MWKQQRIQNPQCSFDVIETMNIWLTISFILSITFNFQIETSQRSKKVGSTLFDSLTCRRYSFDELKVRVWLYDFKILFTLYANKPSTGGKFFVWYFSS